MEKITLELTKQEKELIIEASGLKNTSVSKYIQDAILDELEINKNNINVSNRAAEQLLDSLSKVSEPSTVLIELMKN